MYVRRRVVFQYVKDTIWKQITTTKYLNCSSVKLFFNTSKIQFESKSQPFLKNQLKAHRCFSIRQRYNLKANHNRIYGGYAILNVVFQYVKDTIWKQITTRDKRSPQNEVLFFNTSKIQFESKSQPLYLIIILNLKLFFNTSKIQFESKSQQNQKKKQRLVCCFSIRQRYNLKANHNCHWAHCLLYQVVFQYVKDTIWKQITTN